MVPERFPEPKIPSSVVFDGREKDPLELLFGESVGRVPKHDTSYWVTDRVGVRQSVEMESFTEMVWKGIEAGNLAEHWVTAAMV